MLLPTFRVGLPQRAFLETRRYDSTVLLAGGILTVHTGSSLCNVQVPPLEKDASLSSPR